MKAWYTSDELATLALPGLPTTKRGIALRADKDTWAYQERTGIGGRAREYPVDALPREAREELAAREVATLAKATIAANANATVADLAGLAGRKRDRAETKILIVRLADQFRVRAGIDQTPADKRFADEWNAGRIEADDWLRASAMTLSAASLRRWRIEIEAGRPGVLGGRYRGDRSSGLIEGNPVYRDFVIAQIAHAPHLRPGAVRDAMRARFTGQQLPSCKTLQRFMARWRTEHPRDYEQIANPDSAKNKFRVSFGSQSEQVIRINQVWESDGTPSDAACTNGRHVLVGTIDVFTRRVRVLVARTSKSEAVMANIRRCILDWGKQEIQKTDNGQDFKSRWVRSSLAALDVHHKLCRPFTPEGKPHIERFFGTLTRDLLETLPGYVGHNVADRQAIRARQKFAERLGEGDDKVFKVALSSEQLQAAIDTWIVGVYERSAHEGLNGLTPAEVARAHAGDVQRIENERALDVLLAEPAGNGIRVVGKRGISVDNAFYASPALVAYMGQRVQVRFDAADAGRIVVRDMDGGFVCVAEDPDRTGISRAQLAAEATANQRRLDAQGRAFVRAIKKLHRPELSAGEILDVARAELASVEELPPAGRIYSSPALEEAAKAADALAVPAGWSPRVITSAPVGRDSERKDIDWENVHDTEGWAFERVEYAPERVFLLWVHQNPDAATAEHKAIFDDAMRSTLAKDSLRWSLDYTERQRTRQAERNSAEEGGTRKAAAG